EIISIKLLEKTGGKSQFKFNLINKKAAVVVCSDSISKGKAIDKSGKYLIEKLTEIDFKCHPLIIIPDEKEQIQNQILNLNDVQLLIFSGGTGISSRDVTPEVLQNIITKRLPGIEETFRNYS